MGKTQPVLKERTGEREPAARASLSRVPRLALLDSLRGFTLLHMIVYHALWDLTNLFGVSMPWFHSAAVQLWQQAICWTFILVSGFCWPLGRRALQRGALVLAAGALVSGVSLLASPETAIRFGVLTLIGSCTLLLIPLDRLLKRAPPLAGIGAAMALFLLTRHAAEGLLGWRAVRLPEGLYQNGLTAYLGFPPPSFFSTDYFPLLPWLFLFLTGYFLYHALGEGAFKRALHRGIAPLGFLGRHSLVIYLLHQPILYGIFGFCC